MKSINVSQFNKAYNFWISNVSSIMNPKDNTLLFITKKMMRYYENLNSCSECLVLVPTGTEQEMSNFRQHCILYADNPRLQYARIALKLGESEGNCGNSNIHSSCVIGNNVEIGAHVVIGPFCVIECDVVIGDNTIIRAGAIVKSRSRIGCNCVLGERCVIGSKGFGIEKDEAGNNLCIPQLGGVILEDGVEIGALTVVARGTIGNTRVGRNTKVDSLVNIAHNDNIGENCIITSGVIISGSVYIDDQVHLGPNCSILNKIKIGNHALVGLGSPVFSSVKESCTVVCEPSKLIWKKKYDKL